MANRRLQYATIFLTCFIDILGFGIVIPVLPLYAEHFGATPLEIGWLVGIFSLAQFFFAPLWGKVSDRVGRKPVLLVGMLGTVAGYVVMGLAGSVLMLMVGRLIDGIAGANISAAQAYLADISSAENRARAMGLLGAAFGLGFVFGPALGGWASVKFNYAAPMYIAAGLAAVNFFFVLFCLPESLMHFVSQCCDQIVCIHTLVSIHGEGGVQPAEECLALSINIVVDLHAWATSSNSPFNGFKPFVQSELLTG